MKPLSPLGALWSALRNEECKVYPSENNARIGPKDIAERVRGSLSGVTEPVDETLMAKARESLEEAKGQTEYQDQKVGRLLTIVSFLTAAAGALFSKVADSYPIDPATLLTFRGVLIAVTYLLFFLFVLFVISGALVSFHATRTRFVWASSRGELGVVAGKKPTSHLFFQESVCTSPDKWGESFAAPMEEQAIEAYKGYIVEAYLVNAKVADKLRLLEPAQVILGNAIRLLLLWLLLAALLFAFVARTPKDDQGAVVATKSGPPADSQPKGASPMTESASAAKAAVVGQSIVVNCNSAPTPVKAASRASAPKHAGKCEGSAHQ